MGARPTGTVTFLFSDVEGSTRLLDALGEERYQLALADHRRLIREAVDRHDGYVVDAQGDAFFVAFTTARDAAEAAREAQLALSHHPWPEGADLRVRMGLHTCEVSVTGDGYVGVGVHRGARIGAVGKGGQVVVSQTTHDILREHAPDVGLRDLGSHRLKDFSDPQHLFQLIDERLPAEFPPLRTVSDHVVNLPSQPTALIGRADEVAAVADLLLRDDTRMVTLTGPPGTGKTRLALQVAVEMADTFRDGVFFVGLAPVVDATLVVPSVAQALGINEASGQSLSGYLHDKQLLLVLDNLEQVVDSAPYVAELLSESPGVSLLTTSREALRIAAERVYPVAPLDLPDLDRLPDLPELSQLESVALFVARAQAVAPSFELTADNAGSVAAICVRLDGLPLAIELAAARMSLLTPADALSRLDQRLALLTAGSRDGPSRQQTLRDTLAWSFQLLSAEEQSTFSRLGVFAGGFGLDAAEVVCGATLDAVGSLVDKNLIRRDADRLSMLETMREYAVEQLAASDAIDDMRSRHADHFVDLAERAYAGRISADEQWGNALERDHDNLRAALSWLGTTDPSRALQLASALGWFWQAHSHLTEGQERLEALITATASDRIRARALTALGALAGLQGDIERSRPHLLDGIAVWQGVGETQEEALALESLAWSYFFAGQNESGREAAERSLALQQQVGNVRLINRARLAVCQLVVALGDVECACALAAESMQVAVEQGDGWALHLAHHYLADCALIGQEFETAARRYEQALRAAIAIGNRTESAIELQGVAMAAAGLGQAEWSLRLDTAADAELVAAGVDISGVEFWSKLRFEAREKALSQLDPEAVAAAERGGARMGFDEAVAEALDRAG